VNAAVAVARGLALLASLAGATIASAQAIRPIDYLPLGQGAQWQFQRTAGSGPPDLHLEVTDVNVADSGTRYFMEVPGSAGNLGLRFEYATDGSLRLRSVEGDLNQVLDGLPLDPSATADVAFMPPVLLGAAMLVPGSAVVQTPVDTEFDADLDTNVGSIDLDVHTTGTITATWNPVGGPVVTPAGTFSDLVGLTLDVSLNFFEDTLGSDGNVKITIDAVLARGVGFVQVTAEGTTWALVRAIVNGTPIGDFPQYEDIVAMSFTMPPVIVLNGRALGEASSGDIRLHGALLSQTVYGRGQLDATLDLPAAAGVPVSISGPTKAKGDGTLMVDLEGKTKVGDQKITFLAKQRLDPTSTSLPLKIEVGKTTTIVPIRLVPIVTGAVRISLDGLVDQSAQAGSERKLASNGRLFLGEVEYPIIAKEKLKVKKDGTRKRTYNFKPTDKDVMTVHAEATSTSAADFTFSKVKPTVFKHEVKSSKVSAVAAEVVEP
jgi:hypothetical protein